VNKPAAAIAKLEMVTPNSENLLPGTSHNGDNGGDGTNGNKPDGGDSGGLGAGPIAGIVIGAVPVAAIAAVCVWFFVLRKGMTPKGGS
jgi:hypothetical protein